MTSSTTITTTTAMSRTAETWRAQRYTAVARFSSPMPADREEIRGCRATRALPRHEAERRPGGLRGHHGPHDARSIPVVFGEVRPVEAVVHGGSRLLEGDITLHARGADPTLARRQRTLEPGV